MTTWSLAAGDGFMVFLNQVDILHSDLADLCYPSPLTSADFTQREPVLHGLQEQDETTPLP